MDRKELHAYIRGPDYSAVTRWMESVAIDLRLTETVDLAQEIGREIARFESMYETWELERVVDADLLELTLCPTARESAFAEWDHIILGERLVDDLGGIALVECGGIYAHPLSPSMVRISKGKMELVELPDSIYEPIDEHKTQLIRKREGPAYK